MALRELLIQFGIDVKGQSKLTQAENALNRLKAGSIRAEAGLLRTKTSMARAAVSADRLAKSVNKAKVAAAKTTGSTNRFGGSLERIARYLVLGAIVRGVKNFIQGQFEAADALKHQAETLGITTDELQKYEYVSKLMRVSTNQTVVALRYFNRTIGESELGTKSAQKSLSQLGIKIKDAHGNTKPTSDLLFEFADRLKGVKDQSVRTAFAMRFLGRGGQALLPVLQQGSEELRKYFKDLEDMGGGFTPKFIDGVHQLDTRLQLLALGWRSVYVAVLTEILPVFKKWVEHSIKTVKTLIEMSKHTYAFRTALHMLAATIGVIAAIKVATMFNGWGLAITAAGAALYGLWEIWDDFYTFLVGGRSIIGDQLNQLGGAGNEDRVRQNLKKVFEPFTEAIGPVSDMFTKMNLAFINMIPSIVKWGGIFSTFVIDLLDKAGVYAENLLRILAKNKIFSYGLSGAVIGGAAGSVVPGVGNIAGAIIGGVAGVAGGVTAAAQQPDDPNIKKDLADLQQRADDRLKAVNSFLDLTAKVERSPAAAGPISVTVTQTITGTGDPKATADAANKGVGSAVKTATSRDRDTFGAVITGQPFSGN